MKYLFIFFMTLSSLSLLGQSIQISGRVYDDYSKEGLPFSNVFVEGSSVGVSTDMDGYYSIKLEAVDSLSASALGYSSMRVALSLEPVQEINFRMQSSSLELMEVVVLSGENPANKIVKNIIKNKSKNRIEHLEAYQCESYSKVEMDLSNVDVNSEDARGSRLLKPFAFIFENVDSTSDDKPFLPGFLAEEIMDLHYVKGKGKPKRVSKARKISGVNNQSSIDFLNGIQIDYSIYDNWIPVFEKDLMSPFAANALLFYEYYIEDSTFIEEQWSYRLKFKPKRKGEATFYGYFWVADTSFAIQHVNMRMSEDMNINLVNRVHLFEESAYVNDSIWLPSKQKLLIDMSVLPKSAGIIARRTVSYQDYIIDPRNQKSTYSEIDDYIYSYDELKKEDDFWAASRHEKLSENESGIYEMIEKVQAAPAYKGWSTVLTLLGTGYHVMGPIELGNIYEIYSSNDVEGPRVRLALATSNRFSKRIRTEIYGAYGFKDQAWKYGGDVQINIKKRPRQIIGAAYYNDVSFSSDNSEDFVGGDVFSTFLRRRKIPQKLVHVQEAKVFYEKWWKKGISHRLIFMNRQMDPYETIDSIGDGFDFNYLSGLAFEDTLKTINTSELIFKTRIALDEKYLDGQFWRTPILGKKPRLEFRYVYGIKDFLGSEYNYHKLDLDYKHYFRTNPLGWFSYKFKVGKTFGTLPYLLLEVHPGNDTYVLNRDAFNGMNRFEFASDFYAQGLFEQHFDGFFFSRIPGIRKLDLRLVSSYKVLYGQLSDANREANILNFSDTEKTISVRAPGPLPYMECSVGLENIFRIFRAEAFWRLNYLDNPDARRLSFRVGASLNF